MNLFKNGTIQFYRTLPIFRDQQKISAFTDFYLKKQTEEQNKKLTQGRAWRTDELRLKSSDDLQKLWYVIVKEKNAIVSDNSLKRKIHGTIGPQGRMIKLRKTMARILTVVSERKKVCEEYRKSLEEDYVAKQREKYEQKLIEDEKLKELEPKLPEITSNLLRAKYRDLRRGVDNTDYIKKAVEIETNKTTLLNTLNEKYDYKTKKVVFDPSAEAPTSDNEVILGFKSGILEQLNTGRYKISEHEVLRSHIKNWRMLDLKQKRRVLGVINARRARDAKSEFLKELDLLGQKIAYDNLQEQKFRANA